MRNIKWKVLSAIKDVQPAVSFTKMDMYDDEVRFVENSICHRSK